MNFHKLPINRYITKQGSRAQIGFAAVVVVEASAPKVYPRVTLASASTLSGSVFAAVGVQVISGCL